MRKIFTTLFGGLGIFIIVGSGAPFSRLAQAFETGASLESLAQEFHNPKDLAHFMWRHFQFDYDQNQFGQEEYWQSPEELLANRNGDCEDFAIFAHEILKYMGQPSVILSIYGDRFSHAVCIFKHGGEYQIFDGASLVKSKAGSLTELTSEIYPFWKKIAIVSPVSGSHEGKILQEFNRKA